MNKAEREINELMNSWKKTYHTAQRWSVETQAFGIEMVWKMD